MQLIKKAPVTFNFSRSNYLLVIEELVILQSSVQQISIF